MDQFTNVKMGTSFAKIVIPNCRSALNVDPDKSVSELYILEKILER